MKNFKKISFLSLTLSWIGLIITHIIWSNIQYNSASGGDIGVILFWSAFFMIIHYGLFILIPQKWIVKLTEKLPVFLFTFFFGIYALISFIILIGWGFLITNFYGVFLDAFVCGTIFGFSFYIFWKNYRNQFQQKHLLIILSLPILFLFIYLFAFPKLTPSLAFNSVPQFIRHDIIEKTIPKFKVGDKLIDLQKALPGEFNFENCKGNHGAVFEDFQFTIVINCCKIVKLDYGPRNKKGIIFGEDIPCI